jgi:flagellar biosynthesis chaperone FliJ
LRQLCTRNAIATEIEKDDKQIHKKADRLNSELAKNEVYSKLDQKMVTAWLDLRNKAAHGKYDEYTEDQVKNMLVAVTEFMARVAV